MRLGEQYEAFRDQCGSCKGTIHGLLGFNIGCVEILWGLQGPIWCLYGSIWGLQMTNMGQVGTNVDPVDPIQSLQGTNMGLYGLIWDCRDQYLNCMDQRGLVDDHFGACIIIMVVIIKMCVTHSKCGPSRWLKWGLKGLICGLQGPKWSLNKN